ncbi:MAG: XRE family transcriptional regulator [Pseudomonadota bacterium]
MNAIDDNIASTNLCARVVELRKHHKMTLEQLAAASGVSRSMLSQIERGKANPTLAVTYRIAQAFSMSIGELVDHPTATTVIDVISAADDSMLFRNDDDCQIRTLSPLHLEKNVEFYELRLAPGAALDSAAHFQGTRELLTVTEGQAQIDVDGSLRDLARGDSAHYRADLRHSIRSTDDQTLLAYLVVTTP